jgi:hypothetical protein
MIANPRQQQIPPLRCAPVGMTGYVKSFTGRNDRFGVIASGLLPEFGECAGGSGKWVGGGEADLAHALEDFGSGCGAADVPVFVGWVSADDEEVIGAFDATVAGAGGEYENIARLDGDRFAAFAAEDEVGVAGAESQDFVRGGVVVVKVVDSVAPLWRPAVGSEEVFHFVREIIVCWKGVAVEQDGQRAVGHPPVGFEVELLRRGCWRCFQICSQGFPSSYARGEDTGGEVSAVDRFHDHWMLERVQRSWNSGLPMTSAV